jgi:hypothetical protein
MRFMVMHKVDAVMESGQRPNETIIQDMGRLIGRAIKAGIFKDGAGLHRSATRARVRFEAGAPVVERGPYAGGNELLAAFAMVSTTGMERAIELATELGHAAGDREIEIGPVVEGWDLHGGTRPANAPHRFLLLLKGDATYEVGGALPVAVAALFAAWTRDGVLTTSATLRPSRGAARTRVRGGTRHWTDGPFAESKELVAGFSILEVPTLADAKRFTEEYAAVLGDNEVDIREVAV